MTTTTKQHANTDVPSTARKTSRLYKWFLLVVTLVVVSAVRYYQWNTDKVVNDTEINKAETRLPKHVKKHKDIPPPSRIEKKPHTDDKQHSSKSKTKEETLIDLKKEDTKKASHDDHDDKPGLYDNKESDKNKIKDDTIIQSKNEMTETAVSKDEKKSHGSSRHFDSQDKSSNNNNKSMAKTTDSSTLRPTLQPTMERIKYDSKSNNTTNEVKTEKKKETSISTTTTRPEIITSNTTTMESSSSNNTTETTNHNNTSLIPPYDKIKSSFFTNESCILTNTEWFPSSPSLQWQLRAPRFMLIGDLQVGRIASQLVQQFPSILLSNGHAQQKVAYFSQPSFLRNSQYNNNIHVWKARQQLYAKHYPTKLLQQDSALVTMDATPEYLLYSHFVATSILCVSPWIQIIVVLRNPADLVYASFRRACTQLGWKGTLEEYVRLDMETMERASLIGPEERTTNPNEAWKNYLSQTKDGPVGRGFYALQLQEWKRVLASMGRDFNQAVKVIRYEDYYYKARPGDLQAAVADFVGFIMPVESGNTTTTITLASLSSSSSSSSSLGGGIIMTREENVTMTRLRKFFRPYNKQLYNLLGDEWDGCWDSEHD